MTNYLLKSSLTLSHQNERKNHATKRQRGPGPGTPSVRTTMDHCSAGFGDARRNASACQRRHGHFRGGNLARASATARPKGCRHTYIRCLRESHVPRSVDAREQRSVTQPRRRSIRVREFCPTAAAAVLPISGGGPDSRLAAKELTEDGLPLGGRVVLSTASLRLRALLGGLRRWRWRWRPCCARARARGRVGLLGGGGVLGGGRE